MKEKTKPKKLKRVTSSPLSRSLKIAGAGTGAGLRWMRHSLENTFSTPSSRKEQNEKHLLDQMGAFVALLGELKGTFAKGGQMLSIWGEHVLPPEVNKILKTLQSETPPIEWESMRKVLLKELGKNRLERLEIREEPLATASIGQVYFAREKSTGLELALKVQIPGVAKAVESDIALMGKLFRILKLFTEGGYDWDPVLSEVREMMLQETDYTREFAWTQRFYDRLKDDPLYKVARPVDKYSTRSVLATEYQEGFRVDSPEVAALAQERRNRLSQGAVELFLTELFEWGEVQTDPHFGNYRIWVDPTGQKDKLILFDFGAVRAFPQSFVRHYRTMIRGAWRNDASLIRQGILANGFLKESDSAELWQLLMDLVQDFMEPYREESFTGGSYDFGASDLPQRLVSRGPEIFRAFRLRPPPRELIFLDRRLAGTYVLISKLGAKLDLRPVLEKFLSRKTNLG